MHSCYFQEQSYFYFHCCIYKNFLLIVLSVFIFSSYGGGDDKCAEAVSIGHAGGAAGNKKIGRRAVRLLKREARRGNVQAVVDLGRMYKNGVGVKQNHKKAFRLLKEAALLGRPEAKYDVGVMYKNGEGVKQDDVQAFYWLKQAAEDGVIEAFNVVGVLYREGKGVEKNLERAFYWMEKRGGQGGDKWAQRNLGMRFFIGDGAAPDHEKAVDWFKKAAESGYIPDFDHTGRRYLYGAGINQDDAGAFGMRL